MYQRRSYRNLFRNELFMFEVCVGETDLWIGCTKDLTSLALPKVRRARSILSNYIARHPVFAVTLEPVPMDKSAPVLIQKMIKSAQAAGTGPMAAVAGVISQFVGEALLKESEQVFVENGGDIYIFSDKPRTIGIFAGNSPLSNRIAVKIPKDMFPLGICTSSGTVGHSLSFGKADAVTVLSKDAALADAVATATGNKIKNSNDVKTALNFAINIDGIIGAVAIIGDKVGAVGNIELAKVSNQG
ncbi:MAG: UPF0280 family protein [Clostridia bacterium]|nr:UPF0280 family protein [Clostridia bacterium]MBN2883382.1 UPF0280 family protein [Clostridia bacterium]